MASSKKQLVVIGDSSVYGWGDHEGGGWCERLRMNWMRIEEAPVIYQLGIRGDGLERLAKRWKTEWSVRGELRRNLPDGILVSIGLNDTAKIGRSDGRPQLSSEAFRFGLERLLKDMKNISNVWVLGLTAVNEKAMPFSECLWYSNKACIIYERQIEETCIELDIPFLPIHKTMINYSGWNELLDNDGIHLNSKGHIWILNYIINWNSLRLWSGA
tara:strand:- start:482 stop:1126 length:645 start_codon:yes stop_codon:yes gene_type:complete